MANTSDSGDEGLRSITLHEGDPPRRRKTGRAKKVLIIMIGLMMVLGGGAVLAGFLVSEQLGGQVQRFDAFGGIPEKSRPKKPTGKGAEAVNILLAGSDARTAGEKTTGKDAGDKYKQAGQRSDTLIILHIASDRKSANLISLPRDSWIDIPGHGSNKINSAYSLGGPSLAIQSVEKLTGLRMDHLAVIDWEGFRDLTDALGGVKMTFDEPVEGASREEFPAGENTLSGNEALDYVRARYNLPNGDFDRVKRQQNFLRSLMKQTMSQGTVTNPVKLTKVINAVTNNLSVDEAFSTSTMRNLAIQMRALRANDVTFMTAPNSGTGVEDSQSVVYLDEDLCRQLWKAVRNDNVKSYLNKYGEEDALGQEVN